MQGAAEDHATVRCDVLFDAAHPERAAEAQRLRRALQRTGHAFVRGATMLPPELLRRTFELCRRAHALPQRERLRFSREAQAETLQDRSTVGGAPSRLSYQALEEAYEPGTEATAESWNFSRSREWTAGGAEAISPTGLDGLDGFVDELYSRQDQLALGLLAAIAESFGLPPDTFTQHLQDGDLGTVRLMMYPPRAPSAKQSPSGVGISAHTDFELITLMGQDAAGLQFMFPPEGGSPLAGEWVELPVREGECIVIVNDMMERFTNGARRPAPPASLASADESSSPGELVATPHRVRATPAVRHSIIRFVAVHPDTEVAPLPQFVTAARPARYSRVTMREHMDVTMRAVKDGRGAWDRERGRSLSATRQYGVASL